MQLELMFYISILIGLIRSAKIVLMKKVRRVVSTLMVCTLNCNLLNDKTDVTRGAKT